MAKFACIQINGSNDMQSNVNKASAIISDAARHGAEFVLTPENVFMMIANRDDHLSNLFTMEEHPAIKVFSDLSKKLGIWILIGSVAIKAPSGKILNRSILMNKKGKIVKYYDKIHLYDVILPNGEKYNESERYEGGNCSAVAETPWGKLGMTICYDLRFPHLFRKLAHCGADFISVPSAFTKFTGELHWHILLRARAIETGCYILAPAQVGRHNDKRETYGHALIIDPWGKIIADADEKEGYIIANVDASKVKEFRASIPSLQHDREFE